MIFVMDILSIWLCVAGIIWKGLDLMQIGLDLMQIGLD